MLPENWSMSMSASFLLAVMAAFGYLLGRRRSESRTQSSNSRQEIGRALAVAQELEGIAYRLRKSMSQHVPAIVKFNAQLKRWEQNDGVSWPTLCERAEGLLKPSLRLSNEVSHAYADLLQQMTLLSSFAEMRSDPLTGVANRRVFDEALERLLADHVDADPPLAMMLLDLDHFKRINDEHGHLRGDKVLQDAAELLKATVRHGDVLARYGGEEFVVLLPRTPLRASCNLAERIRLRLGERLGTTVSIGVAASLRNESATSLIARADAALYAAKQQGRDRTALHEGPSGRVVAVHGESAKPELTAAGDSPVVIGKPAVAIYHGEAC